jgi:GH15 family glucan-1,4-alpha-glucosidase
LILETHYETADGAATVVDFMPPRDRNSNLVRLVRGDRGCVRFHTELVLRFDYGTVIPWVTHLEDRTWRAIGGPNMAVLRTPVDLVGRDFRTIAEFDVRAGQTLPFVMTYGPSHLDPPVAADPIESLSATETFWNEWAAKAQFTGEWSDAVVRSLVVLKALTYAPTGGIVAAPTTSLPEQPGGQRNWDYRFCWLRDATLTLLALMNAGYEAEARAWRDWLLRAAAGAPSQMQIMYGIGGERRLLESTADWLPGYEGSRPVRIGNAAHSQLQLDVYGEVMDVLHQARRGGIVHDAADWDFQRELLAHLETTWESPDEGIWEVRGPRRHFTYSKVMAWVAFDRAIQSAEAFGLDGSVDRWKAVQRRIHRDVCEHAFNPALGSFVQSYGSNLLDASLLLLPSTGFLHPGDPRIVGTVAAVERYLVRDGLVARYDSASTDDGLPPGEGTFLACSFWLADAYVLLGRMDDARALFERLLGLRNDLGLLAEEFHVETRRQLGNYPQAFSHVGIINTAHNLTSAAKPIEQRSGKAAQS